MACYVHMYCSVNLRHSHDETLSFVLGRTMFQTLLTTYGHNPTFNRAPLPATGVKQLLIK